MNKEKSRLAASWHVVWTISFLAMARVCVGGASQDGTFFTNPIGEAAAPDPFVAYDAATDFYYCLFTEGTAVSIRRAKRPERLLADGDAKTVFATNAALNVHRHLWAPEMHKAPNGKWYVYTSADVTVGPEWTLRLVCLESESSDPFDGFHFKSFPLPDVQAIDPTVHWTADGRGHLACARMGGGGEWIELRELENPWTCRGEGVVLARPTLAWEKKAGSILEGPFFVEGTGGNLFLVYSANDTRSEHYALGALAFNGADLMDAAAWTKRKEPVLFKANGVYGPGHASFFRTRGGELWCAYHGMDAPDGAGPSAKPRKMHLQPADPDDDGCPHLAGAWGKGPHRVPDAPKEKLPPLPEGAFSYVVIPDTQRYSGAGSWGNSSAPTRNAAFESRVNWILKHAKDQNVAFVSHVGDVSDRNNAPQYQFASNLMSRLDGVVPWRVAAGNHDMVDKTGDTANFERWFGSPNRVDLFEAGGMKFVLVTIVCNAPESVMRWADEQLEKHADRKAIVCTHAYLGPIDPSDRTRYACREPHTWKYELRIPDARLGRMPWLSAFGEYSTTNGVGHSGETMWRDHFSKHKNLFLIVCGDQSAVVSQHLEDVGAHGNVVHAFMQDYPRDNDRIDPVRVFRFLPAEKRVEVFTVMTGEDVLCTRAKFLEEH
ncbi:MAG: family 43 glycosylhydrolase, partial [Kiritimatiellae bacterium]|nr:family 43 glycosylhydrolase [Kiritimatiellia bacterium]